MYSERGLDIQQQSVAIGAQQTIMSSLTGSVKCDLKGRLNRRIYNTVFSDLQRYDQEVCILYIMVLKTNDY